jgi:hypothetical protein
MRLLALLLLATNCLTSCGTFYKNPPNDPALTAVLRNARQRQSFYDWRDFKVEGIDGKPVTYLDSFVPSSKKLVVTAGTHRILIYGTFLKGFANGPYEAREEVIATFKPGRTYVCTGAVSGAKLQLWIKDSASNERVSNVVSATYSRIVSPTPVYVPVIISG